MSELLLRAVNLACLLAAAFLLKEQQALLVEPGLPALTILAALAAQSAMVLAQRPRREEHAALWASAGLASDLALACWTIQWMGAWRSELFAALLLPALLLGLRHGPGAAALGGLLAAILEAIYASRTLPPEVLAWRSAVLILVPAAACWRAQAVKLDSVSRARRTAAYLRAAQIGEFLSWVLYQLREYSISIASVSESLALMAPKDNAPMVEKTERLRRLILELNAKTGRLLGDRSRLTTSAAAAVGPFDLAELTQDTAAAARQAYASSPIELRVTKEGPLEVVGCDRRALQLSLLAVLQNSMEACSARCGGTVSVSVRQEGESAEIEVSDDGGGIAEASQAGIFEPLISARAATGGMGLGLPMSRRLLERLGGTLRLKSRLGGTAVLLSVPLTRALPRVRIEESTWAGRRKDA